MINYASRRTTKLEESYSACELECIALVWAIKHFRDYMMGRKVEVITDQWALKWLQDLRNCNPRLRRWTIAIQGFDLEVSHKPGKQHRNAGFLSRMYEGQSNPLKVTTSQLSCRTKESEVVPASQKQRNLPPGTKPTTRTQTNRSERPADAAFQGKPGASLTGTRVGMGGKLENLRGEASLEA